MRMNFAFVFRFDTASKLILFNPMAWPDFSYFLHQLNLTNPKLFEFIILNFLLDLSLLNGFILFRFFLNRLFLLFTFLLFLFSCIPISVHFLFVYHCFLRLFFLYLHFLFLLRLSLRQVLVKLKCIPVLEILWDLQKTSVLIWNY